MGGAKLAGPVSEGTSNPCLFHWLERTDWLRSPTAHFPKVTRSLFQVVIFLCPWSNVYSNLSLFLPSFLSPLLPPSSSLSPSLCYRNPFFSLEKVVSAASKKSYFLTAIMKLDNKKVVTLKPTRKTESQIQFFPPHKASGPMTSNPFSRLIRAKANRWPKRWVSCRRSCIIGWKAGWNHRGAAQWEPLPGCELMKVIHHFTTFTSYLWSLMSMNCHIQTIKITPM